jgi:hypothetical protein
MKLLTCFTTSPSVAETTNQNTTEITVSKEARPQTFAEILHAGNKSTS